VIDLPNHPTLSRPFTSKALAELATQGCELVRKENAALWKVKPLLTRLHGDHNWAPCGLMTDSNDIDLFAEDFINVIPSQALLASIVTADTTPTVVNGAGKSAGPSSITAPGADNSGEGKVSSDNKPEETSSNQDAEKTSSKVNGEKEANTTQESKADDTVSKKPDANGELNKAPEGEEGSKTKEADTSTAPARDNDVEMTESTDVAAASRKAAVDGKQQRLSLTPDVSDNLFIHPLFIPPRSSRPDRDQGLPDQEAEDVRRLLQLYVQKQEEVCRETSKLFEGLLKAERYRKTVLKWAKAEAHCGDRREMSDGEDWYDKEEWGLVDDLKKGQDEEEEDTTQTQKKTRNRR
jgi:hypothetical protein